MQVIEFPSQAASVTAGILVVGGGIVIGALGMRALLDLLSKRRSVTPECGTKSVWSEGAQRCIPAPSPTQPPPQPPAEDDWGTGMTASTQALVEGIPVRLFRDERGQWNFGYSWRRDRGAVGDVAGYLQDDPDEDTVLVFSHSPDPERAYNEASGWVENRLVPFVRSKGIPFGVPASVAAMSPIMWEGDRQDHWAVVAPAATPVEGRTDMRYWDYERPEYMAATRNGETYVGGCCYDHNKAWSEALRYY